MLQQVLENIHNMFIKSPNPGTYTITDGSLSLPFAKDGQRIWIVGSDLNDGVYTYHSDCIHNDDDTTEVGLQDETFAGTICALAVPPAVIALSEEISAWVDKYSDTNDNPYMSENVIGVYTYQKAMYGSGAGGRITWQDIFKNRLDRWRKVSL